MYGFAEDGAATVINKHARGKLGKKAKERKEEEIVLGEAASVVQSFIRLRLLLMALRKKKQAAADEKKLPAKEQKERNEAASAIQKKAKAKKKAKKDKMVAEEKRQSMTRLHGLLSTHIAAMDDQGLVFERTFRTAKLGFSIILARYGNMGREFILVAAVDPACEFHRQLRPTDELIAVNGNVICEPQRFGALSRTIYQAERPLTLTFIQGIDRDAAFEKQEKERRDKGGAMAGGNCCKTPDADVADPSGDHPGSSGAWASRVRSSSADSEASIDENGNLAASGAGDAADPFATKQQLGLFLLCNSFACDNDLPPGEGDADLAFAPADPATPTTPTGLP